MTTFEALPRRWRADRLVCSDRARLDGARVTVDDDALVVVAASARGTSVVGYGDEGAAARTVTQLVEAGGLAGPVRWVTLPRDVDLPAAVTAELGVEPLPGWDWLTVDSVAARQPREEDVTRLDPARDTDAIRDCLEAANPGTNADPAGPREVAWWGVRAPDGLAGVIGATRRGSDDAARETWHLHGLGVRPTSRRDGLGRALTAAAVRDGLGAGASWVSLGVWADNEPALAIYASLGFRTDHRRRSYRPVGTPVEYREH